MRRPGCAVVSISLSAIAVQSPVGRWIKGEIALIHHVAAFRPGPISSTTASAKATMRLWARRWLLLSDEVTEHD